MSNTLKYRIICPECNKAFDSRTAHNFNGYCICPECYNAKKFKTYLDYE